MGRILKKRSVMILLALMLIMGLAPMTASAEPGTENKATSVTVSDVTLNDGDRATTDKDGTVRKQEPGEENYNVMFSDGILYLRNATIVASSGNHGINANGDITIDISGINSVTGGSNSQGAEEASDGIFAKGDIIITSTSDSNGGSLTAAGGAATYSGGIYSSGGDVTINGDVEKITAEGEKAASGSVGIGAEAGNVIINGGTVEATGDEATTNGASNGIWAAGDEAGEIYINGGSVTANGGKAVNGDGICAENHIRINTTGNVKANGGEGKHSNGICSGSGDISINANIEAKAGKANTDSSGTESQTVRKGGHIVGTDNNSSVGISAEGGAVSVNGGTVVANGSEALDNNGVSDGIRAAEGITIKDGVVSAAGDKAKYSGGIFSEAGDVIIEGGKVSSSGGHASGENSGSVGIGSDTGSVNISGGSVETEGCCADGTDSVSDGIRAYEDIIISGGSVFAESQRYTVEADPSGYSGGIFSEAGDVIISGDSTDVTALGGEGSDGSVGISAMNGNAIIKGGVVLAFGAESKGETYGINASDVIASPAQGKMIAAETGSDIEIDSTGTISVIGAAAIEGSPFKTETSMGKSFGPVFHSYTADVTDVTPGTDDPAGKDDTTKGKAGTPGTGDDFNAAPMIALMALAAAAGGIVVYGTRKKHRA